MKYQAENFIDKHILNNIQKIQQAECSNKAVGLNSTQRSPNFTQVTNYSSQKIA